MPDAPSAPAAAPAAASSAPQTPPPAQATPTERAPSEFMADIEGDFADMDAGRQPAKRDDKGKFTPVEKPKGQEKPAEKPSEKPVEGDKPTEVAAEKPGEAPKPVKAAELRTAYEGLKKKVSQELEPEIQKLRAKVQEYETKGPTDTAPILQKLQATEQRAQQAEKALAHLDYSQSEDFRTKYSQPYSEAWTDAVSEFRQLRVRESAGIDEATGDPKFTARPANEDDLLKLANMSLADMDEAATAMFGPSASRAIGHLQNIRKLSSAQHKALEDAKTKSVEWRQQRQVEFQQRQQNANKTWEEINRGLEERFPKAFKVDDTDPEDKGGHTKGFALADLLFLGNNALTPEQVEALPAGFRDTVKSKKPLTEAQKVQLHALARIKMANHDRMIPRLKKANARIAELEKSLAEFEKSEPSAARAGEGGQVSNKSWDQQVEDELRALDKK